MRTEAHNIQIKKLNRKFAKISFDVSQFGDEDDKDVIFNEPFFDKYMEKRIKTIVEEYCKHYKKMNEGWEEFLKRKTGNKEEDDKIQQEILDGFFGKKEAEVRFGHMTQHTIHAGELEYKGYVGEIEKNLNLDTYIVLVRKKGESNSLFSFYSGKFDSIENLFHFKVDRWIYMKMQEWSNQMQKFNLSYKGYIAECHYDSEDAMYYGEVTNIKDSLNFYGKDKIELEKNFHQSIDNYFEICKSVDKDPEKPQKEEPVKVATKDD